MLDTNWCSSLLFCFFFFFFWSQCRRLFESWSEWKFLLFIDCEGGGRGGERNMESGPTVTPSTPLITGLNVPQQYEHLNGWLQHNLRLACLKVSPWVWSITKTNQDRQSRHRGLQYCFKEFMIFSTVGSLNISFPYSKKTMPEGCN